MPRLPVAGPGDLPVPPRHEPQLLRQFKELSSWLCDTLYPDGRAIGLVALTIRPRDYGYIVQLRIQDHGGLVLSAEDQRLEDALIALEAALNASPVPWVKDRFPLGQVTTQKKK